MKPTILTILLLVPVLFGFSNEQVQLPKEPWKAIVEMTKYSPNNRWEDNISVKLLGNFTNQDSVMVVNAIETLNGLTETVKLNLTSEDWGNLKIYFIDSTNRANYQGFFPLQSKDTYRYTFTTKIGIPENPGLLAHFEMAVQLLSVPDSAKQNFITNQLAHAMFPVYWQNDEGFKNGGYEGPASIFLSCRPVEIVPYYLELIDFDREVIKTVYSSNYAVLLPIAKKQFKKFKIPEWVRNLSHEMLVFPFVLTVFLLVGLFIFLYRKLFSRIRDKWLQFNAISVLAMPLLGLLISLYFMTALTLKHPYANHFNYHNFFVGMLLATLLGLPAVNLIRLIETIIHRKAQQKYFKVLLLFLSTSLLPSGTLISIAYFSFKKDLNDEGIHAMILIFLTFVFIGIIRALISFFILKEKEIKIETEVKLANLRELKTKAELNALHSKINPHFLYNALNSIAGLAKTDAEKTEHMALSLSKLFRYSINKEQSDWSTFEEELNMVRIYLDIEKVRFNERLEFSINLPNELRSAQVPRFLIQPLAENSVKHGISKLTEKGQIQISVAQNGKYTEISVRDNGPDFPNELIPGFGLQSIHDKLEILYPNRFELHFVHSPNKKILIKLF